MKPALPSPSRFSPRVWADLALLIVAVIWGSAFVGQRTAMEHSGPFTFAAARFALGGLMLLPLVRRRKRASARLARSGILLGLLLFGGASLQQIGLIYTTAGKAGFITGLYTVIVPLLLTAIWRERVGWHCWTGAGLAAAGLYLLSVQGGLRLAPGDGWVLAGAFMWALHVITVGRLAPDLDPFQLALAQYIVCALASALTALLVEWGTWAGVLAAWPGVVYTGIFSIGIGYTVQIIAQRHAPPTHTAIILSLESVFAALTGWLLLGEVMTPRMLGGALLVLLGILAATAYGPSASSSRYPQTIKSPNEKIA